MTALCPERIAVGVLVYATCHRPVGHHGLHHAAGRSWRSHGEQGQCLVDGTPCYADCHPVPRPPRQGNPAGADPGGDSGGVSDEPPF